MIESLHNEIESINKALVEMNVNVRSSIESNGTYVIFSNTNNYWIDENTVIISLLDKRRIVNLEIEEFQKYDIQLNNFLKKWKH